MVNSATSMGMASMFGKRRNDKSIVFGVYTYEDVKIYGFYLPLAFAVTSELESTDFL